ncbi:MAG: NAD-dependent epimerase/dehydratase family protein [Hyphomicrobiales bacterium]
MSDPKSTKTALITGTAGFIGFHLAKALLDAGYRVIGFDALTDYYDVLLKQRRHQMLLQNAGFSAVEERLETPGVLRGLMAEHTPDLVVHLAAQAGVRYSIDEPRSYVDSNLIGTFELLEALRAHPPKHAMIASSSSVYGANTDLPYAEHDKADYQLSFYGATKKATEAMAHSYAHLYGLPITMFRFFTVYGPWGRPDMAIFKFTKAILAGQPIDVYNHGDMRRDFTFVEDLVKALADLADIAPTVPQVDEDDRAPGQSPAAPWRVVNIGNNQPVPLTAFIDAIETAIGQKAVRNLMPMQDGDVPATWADCTLLTELVDEVPQTPVEEGIARFVAWYRDYYQV